MRTFPVIPCRLVLRLLLICILMLRWRSGEGLCGVTLQGWDEFPHFGCHCDAAKLSL